MNGLRNDLVPFLIAPHSALLLGHYVHSGHFTGGKFETYAHMRSSPNEITGDDIAAVTTLAIRITLGGRSDIRPGHILALEERAADVRALLRDIPSARALNTLDGEEFDRWLGEESPASQLHELLRRQVGLPRVATYKLLARKRPHLLPVRDTKVEAVLHPGEAAWWRPWWEELTSRTTLVETLGRVREDAEVGHLSLLRVADICVWMWVHGVDTDDRCPDLRGRVGPPPVPHR